jgi:hypothetical protein
MKASESQLGSMNPCMETMEEGMQVVWMVIIVLLAGVEFEELETLAI